MCCRWWWEKHRIIDKDNSFLNIDCVCVVRSGEYIPLDCRIPDRYPHFNRKGWDNTKRVPHLALYSDAAVLMVMASAQLALVVLNSSSEAKSSTLNVASISFFMFAVLYEIKVGIIAGS